MGIFDRLFGTDDPLKDELKSVSDDDEGLQEVEEDEEDWPPENVLYGEKVWPYEIEPVDSQKLAGRELYTIDENNDFFAGKDIRDMIENRRYAPEEATRIGYTKDNVKGVQDVYIDHNALFRHIALFGQTGFGKSTLMRNIMLQWINAEFGICYIDPKGDDSYELLQQLPPHRLDDVVWVEPGSDREKQIGFNVFDTESEPGDDSYEREVNSVAGDFTQILKDKSEYWGPQIGNITETLIKQLIRAEDPFNPIDLVKILTDEEERELFAENYGDELEQVFMKQIANQEQDAFDPILRRVRSWVENRTTRQVMAHAESQINISEVVRDGKILIVNTASIESRNAKEIVTRMVISRVWSAVRARKTETDVEPDPFFLCIDEFDKVISDSFDINDIISQARSFRLSVFVANQQPSQLPDDVKQALQQVQSLMSFNPGNNPADAQDIAHVLGDVDAWELNDIDRFKVVGRPYMSGSQQSAMIVHTYGEYPPLREQDAAEAILQKSLEKYGTEPKINTDMNEYGAKRFIEKKSTGYQINEAGDTITEEQLLECVYTAQLRNETRTINDKDDWVTLDQVISEVEKYVGALDNSYASNLSNIFEKFTERELERSVSDEAYFRLGNEGMRKAFEQDTGSAASGGKSPHRILLREGHKAFTKLGYDVRLPSQDEAGSLPDGLASPPINPMNESENFDEAVEKEMELVQKYPRLAQLFGDNEVALEAESTTITRPAQTIKNLIKAIQNNRHCVFLVKDGRAKRDEFVYWARVGADILTDPPFVRSADEHGNRTFYTTNNKIRLSNDSRALIPKDAGEAVWHEYGKQHQAPDDERIQLRLDATNSDEPLAKFEDASDLLRKPAPSSFPYHYYRDTSSKKTIVKDREGNEVKRYDNLSEMRRDGEFRTVHMPIIPDYEFPDGQYPDPNDWTFVIIPEGNERGPQVYENGETKPLLPEHGAKIDPQDFEDMNIEFDIESMVPKEQIKSEFDDIVSETSSKDNSDSTNSSPASDTEDSESDDTGITDITSTEIEESQTSAVGGVSEESENAEDEDEDEDDAENNEDDEEERDLTDYTFPTPPGEEDSEENE